MLSWQLSKLVADVLLPPLDGLLPAFAGLLVLRRRPRLGRGLIAFGLLWLTALSLPLVSNVLLRPLESRYPALPLGSLERLDADAIVVIGSGRYRNAPEFGLEDDLRQLALDRLRYGAFLARQSGKPILASGGRPDGWGMPEARIMKTVLGRDFGVDARWTEERSENTRQNAEYSAAILLPQGVRRIALVTHAFHMPRAVAAFEAAGFEVLPAPMAFLASEPGFQAMDLIPRYDVLRLSGFALHEALGLLWYRLARE